MGCPPRGKASLRRVERRGLGIVSDEARSGEEVRRVKDGDRRWASLLKE